MLRNSGGDPATVAKFASKWLGEISLRLLIAVALGAEIENCSKCLNFGWGNSFCSELLVAHFKPLRELAF